VLKEEGRIQVFINKDICNNILPKLLLLLLPAGEEESKLKGTLKLIESDPSSKDINARH